MGAESAVDTRSDSGGLFWLRAFSLVDMVDHGLESCTSAPNVSEDACDPLPGELLVDSCLLTSESVLSDAVGVLPVCMSLSLTLY